MTIIRVGFDILIAMITGLTLYFLIVGALVYILSGQLVFIIFIPALVGAGILLAHSLKPNGKRDHLI